MNIDLSDSDMEETRGPALPKASKGNGTDDAKSFKPNPGAFASGDESEVDASEFESESDGDDEGSDAEEFSGFGHADSSQDEEEGEDEGDEDEDEDMVIQEPELPSDAFDSDDETGTGGDLRDFVDSLPGSKKRKVEFEQGEGQGEGVAEADAGKKKRRVLPSMQGPGGRNEGGDFGLNPSMWIVALISRKRTDSYSPPSLQAHPDVAACLGPIIQGFRNGTAQSGHGIQGLQGRPDIDLEAGNAVCTSAHCCHGASRPRSGI